MVGRDGVDGEARRARVIENGSADFARDPPVVGGASDGSLDALEDLGESRIVLDD